ncbi:MAG: hypothetical protein LBU32_18040 [Clostridiales bacterium]|nr:hypothetical protein [Clostridiales bacterium]
MRISISSELTAKTGYQLSLPAADLQNRAFLNPFACRALNAPIIRVDNRRVLMRFAVKRPMVGAWLIACDPYSQAMTSKR